MFNTFYNLVKIIYNLFIYKLYINIYIIIYFYFCIKFFFLEYLRIFRKINLLIYLLTPKYK